MRQEALQFEDMAEIVVLSSCSLHKLKGNMKAISYHRNDKRESIFSSPFLPDPDQSLRLLAEQMGIKIRFDRDKDLEGKRKFLKRLSLLEI